MKCLLIDENLPPALAGIFAKSQIEAKHVIGLDLGGESDQTLWQQAQRLDAAIVTKDADFVELATLRNEGKVILFKVGNLRVREVLLFAESQLGAISDFLVSDDQVIVLRP